MLASPSGKPRAGSSVLLTFVPLFHGKMAVFDQTEPLDWVSATPITAGVIELGMPEPVPNV